MPIATGAIVDTGLSADGNSLIVVQQPRILSVRLDSRAVVEALAYQTPKPRSPERNTCSRRLGNAQVMSDDAPLPVAWEKYLRGKNARP